MWPGTLSLPRAPFLFGWLTPGHYQVYFMNNPISGIILLIGLVIEKPLLAVGCLIGLSVLDECTSSFAT